MRWDKLVGIDLVESAVDAVDRFVQTPDEKAQVKAALETRLSEYSANLEETIRAELTVREKILVAEIQHGDTFTRRLRPTIGYSGLALMAWQGVIVPTLEAVFAISIPNVGMPEPFWVAWGGVCGVYMIGRSWEKRGAVEHLKAGAGRSE